MEKLGKLKRVDDLRKVWPHEARDFTNWLARPENLAILSEEISIDIILKKTEANVGRFNVDILAEEENSNRKIIIENQLEATNHDHLGKIITYASGYDAEIIIWIVKDVRDEHKQAVDWLNEHTDEKINIFIIKMELWQIGNSAMAPKFQIISEPNDWAKAIKQSAQSQDLSNTKSTQLDFWSDFKQFVAKQSNNRLRLRKPRPQHWYDISIGSSSAHISLSINSQKKEIGCEIYIPDDKNLYQALFAEKAQIEKQLDEHLDWMELEEKKASRIKLHIQGDIGIPEKWPAYFRLLFETASKFHVVFGKSIRKASHN